MVLGGQKWGPLKLWECPAPTWKSLWGRGQGVLSRGLLHLLYIDLCHWLALSAAQMQSWSQLRAGLRLVSSPSPHLSAYHYYTESVLVCFPLTRAHSLGHHLSFPPPTHSESPRSEARNGASPSQVDSGRLGELQSLSVAARRRQLHCLSLLPEAPRSQQAGSCCPRRLQTGSQASASPRERETGLALE